MSILFIFVRLIEFGIAFAALVLISRYITKCFNDSGIGNSIANWIDSWRKNGKE